MIDIDHWNAFCEVSPWGSFLFTLQRQKKVCTPGGEAIMKIHKKLFSGIPFNFTLFVISPKLQRIWSWNFGFAIRKIWAFIWYQKIYHFRLSPGGWECDRHNMKLQNLLVTRLPIAQVLFLYFSLFLFLKVCMLLCYLKKKKQKQRKKERKEKRGKVPHKDSLLKVHFNCSRHMILKTNVPRQLFYYSLFIISADY